MKAKSGTNFFQRVFYVSLRHPTFTFYGKSGKKRNGTV